MFTLPATEEMTLRDWIAANHYMTPSAFSQLKRKTRLGGIPLPLIFQSNPSSRISFESVSETAQYHRIKNTEALNRFNAEVEAWASKVEGELKASAQSKFAHRPSGKVIALSPRLAESIKANVKKDKQHKLEAKSIGFSIARHGVYLQKGASKGHGGFKGSKWLTQKMNWMTTDAKSIGKMDTGSSEAVDWFNSVINRHLDELVRIVADYSLDIVVTKGGMLISN